MSGPLISAVTAFFPVVMSTYSGIRQVDQGLIKAARDLGARGAQVQLKVVLPKYPIPTAQFSIVVFEDTAPINNASPNGL